jgi:hypothetical protein
MLDSLRILALGASLSLTAQLYGDLREGDKQLPGVKMELACGSETARATTDSAGAFVLFVKQPGKCVLKVVYQDQTATLPVVLYNEPVRYRLALERKGSAFVLTRR